MAAQRGIIPQELAAIGWRLSAGGLPRLLERILAHGGAYYFDAPDFVPDALIEGRED